MRQAVAVDFLVIGRDGDDAGAPKRRSDVRERHLAGFAALIRAGRIRFAALMQNDDGQARGSMIACSFDSREELNAWLRDEPYVTDGVWVTVEVSQCKIAT